jgi:hypothetical protein
VRRQVKEGFLSLETIETWIVYVCHSEVEWAQSTTQRTSSQLWEALESTLGSIPMEGFQHRQIEDGSVGKRRGSSQY